MEHDAKYRRCRSRCKSKKCKRGCKARSKARSKRRSKARKSPRRMYKSPPYGKSWKSDIAKEIRKARERENARELVTELLRYKTRTPTPARGCVMRPDAKYHNSPERGGKPPYSARDCCGLIRESHDGKKWKSTKFGNDKCIWIPEE
jgi:hypothetical protein